ncbi:hypothetical protein [Clostridium sp.]|uniref:hypothetical protein n=1 Tax=Clostridium sp. TaxID=1506 RepID=UPI00284F0A3F|nr:hypothetical protein [Clostridium sp.]MDR3593564.1 hypothetical protein [Clostridium sp.]
MENYRCIATNCDKCATCGHYKAKSTFRRKFVKEDLSDICLPNYRLYSDGDRPYQVYSCKESYKELFNFYDNECSGENCSYQKDYKGIMKDGSCIECKLGDHITCTNPKHPTNKIISQMIECLKAEIKAFEDAGITEGTVTYACPVCGGEAVASRYLYDGSYHGLGSGCKTCGTWHT